MARALEGGSAVAFGDLPYGLRPSAHSQEGCEEGSGEESCREEGCEGSGQEVLLQEGPLEEGPGEEGRRQKAGQVIEAKGRNSRSVAKTYAAKK